MVLLLRVFLNVLVGFSVVTAMLTHQSAHANSNTTALIKPEAALDGKPVEITFCIFDPLGKYGDAYLKAQDLVLAARKWNLFVDLKLYTDERIAAEDFKAGVCEGTAISTLRAKQFNLFMGSIDSIGTIPSIDHMRSLIRTLANPKVIPYTITGKYQIIGVVPLGAAYVFVNDRSINSIEAAAGKKVAVLGWDPAQAEMVELMGAAPVASDITNFGTKFNNRQVDIIVAPALAYKPLELYKGLEQNGGIFRFPLAMVTGSIVINREKMLEKVPDLDTKLLAMREYAFAAVEEAFRIIEKSEAGIAPEHWMTLTPEDENKYSIMMREARIQLTSRGYYDPKMMAILKRVRCIHEPARAECSMSDE